MRSFFCFYKIELFKASITSFLFLTETGILLLSFKIR